MSENPLEPHNAFLVCFYKTAILVSSCVQALAECLTELSCTQAQQNTQQEVQHSQEDLQNMVGLVRLLLKKEQYIAQLREMNNKVESVLSSLFLPLCHASSLGDAYL